MNTLSTYFRAGIAGLLLAGSSPSVLAVSVTFDVQPRVLALDESARATITVEGMQNAPEPQLPALPGFQVQASGRQQSFSFVNGAQSHSVTFTYTLVPQAAGTFTLGPVTYEAANQRFQMPAVQVQVTPPGAASAGAQGAQQLSDMLFARITTERPAVFNQEQFYITIAVYHRGVNLDRDISLVNMPTTGLSVEEFRESPSGREVVNNAIYNVRRFTARATALTAGTFKFEPTLRVNMVVQNRNRNQDPFFGNIDAFFFGRTETRPVDLNCPPVEIQVRPLPQENRPSSFSGAVGKFEFEVDVKPTELNAGDPITMTTRVTGRGNMNAISPPPLALGDAFKAYDAKLTNRESDDARNLGRLTFEQVVIPKSKEVKEIPGIEFSYFDPELGTYQVLRQGPFPLVVHQGSNTASSALVQLTQPASAPQTKMLGTDILYLKSAPKAWQRAVDVEFFRSAGFLAVQSIPVLALATLFVAVRRRRELERDVSRARRLQAPKAARAALAQAEAAARAQDPARFYEALWAGLAQYFGNRLNLPPGEITREEFLPRLRKGGLDETSLQKLNSLVDQCEQARFGAGTTGFSAESAMEQLRGATQLLRDCERINL